MNIKAFIHKLFHRKPTVGFVSDIDKFLAEFDARNPKKSRSQSKEIAKYQKIFALRDTPKVNESKSDIWEGF